MNTPAIINPMAAQQGARQKSKPADTSAPETPFNQVLSREIAGRDQPQKTETAERPNTSAKAANDQGTKATTKSSDKEKTKAVDDTSATAAVAVPEQAAPVVAAMPADILALVTDLSKLAPADPSVATETPVLGTETTGKRGQTIDLIDIGSRLADGVAAAPEDNTDFTSMLRQATTTAQDTVTVPANDTPDNFIALQAVDTSAVVDAPDTGTPLMTPALQQAALTAAHAANNNPTDRIAPRVGTPAWDNALSQKIVWMVGGAQQSASLTLNPPDLGPLQVVLNVSNSQATANFTAAQPEVRQALEAAMPRLREMLGDAGIELAQTSVSTGTPGQQYEGPGDNSRRNGNSSGKGNDGDDGAIAPAPTRVISSGEGLVDTFV